jgi:hypothetical protein
MLDYVGNKREMLTSKSVLIVLPIGQNEPPVPIGSPTQRNKPIGDKNRITSMALKRASCAGQGKDGRSGKGVVGQKTEYGREVMCISPRHVEGNRGEVVKGSWDNGVET